jgi:hypothetical protein
VVAKATETFDLHGRSLEKQFMSEAHAGSHAAAAAPFAEAEIHEFHASDIAAGRVIVLLMAGIFTVGLVLYTAVALVV